MDLLSDFSGVISAHWFGFHDPHSGIHHYEWCIGTTAGACEVRDWENIQKSDIVSRSGLSLPSSSQLFVSLKAVNNVGLEVVRSSDPTIVDTTPPVFTVNPQFDMTGVGLVANMQIDRSQVGHFLWI